MLKRRQLEVKLFNNIYTQTAFYDPDGKKTKSGSRATYFAGIFQLLYGISPAINIGFDTYLKSVLNGPDSSSPFSILRFTNDSNSRTTPTPFGPKVKFAPFKKIAGLSIQSTFLFPLASDLQGQNNHKPYLDHDGYVWWTQCYYDRSLTHLWQLFAEFDIYYKIDRKFKTENSSIATPIKTFISHFPKPNITIYGMVEFAPTLGENIISSFYSQTGFGGKYQLSRVLEIEALVTKFFAGSNYAGAGSTYNLGLRFLR